MDEVPGKLVVWDGEKFRFEQDEGSWSWWSYAKLFWKYGMAPYRTQKLVQAAVASYLRLYDEPWFPFRSLTERAYALGLVKLTGMTGQQYLEANKVSLRSYSRPSDSYLLTIKLGEPSIFRGHYPSSHSRELRFQPGIHPRAGFYGLNGSR